MARCRLGSGAFSVAFAAVLSPAPMRPFPPPALRTGRAGFPHPALQCDHATRTRDVGSGGSPSRYRWLCVPPVSRSCAASPMRWPSPSRRRACSRPGGTKPIRPGPFAYACDASELSAPSRGVRRRCHSRGPSLLRHPSTPVAPFLGGRYPASSLLRASPPPCRPSLPLSGSRLPRARHRQGFPCCCAFHLPCMPTPLPRRKPAGALVARFPAGRRPSPNDRRVGFRINRFEACSVFTRVPACMVAEPPKAALFSRVLQSMSLPPRTALAATSRSDSCWVGFAPTGKARLSTAHCHVKFTFLLVPTATARPVSGTHPAGARSSE